LTWNHGLTCDRQPVGDVAGLEAEVVLFPGGIDVITAFKDHLNSAILFLQIPAHGAQHVVTKTLWYNTAK